MSTIDVIGIDLGKNSFHLIGHDSHGAEVLRKKFTKPKMLEFLSNHSEVIVAMEACGGANWLARTLENYGHNVKLIPPQYVKPYVKSHKNDFIDADAIAEAAARPTMRFVSPKSEYHQITTVIRRIRAAYIKQRTSFMNRIGSILLEFGVSFPTGHHHMKNLFQWLADKQVSIPSLLMLELKELWDHYDYLNTKIKHQEHKLKEALKDNLLTKLLQTIPGVGPITAACCVSSVSNIRDFKNGRNFSAWIGLVPFQYSTGGKSRMLGISKRGNKELRELFIHGARAVICRYKSMDSCFGKWLPELRSRKPFNVAVVAVANKIARIAWSVMINNKPFKSNY